MSVLDDLLVVLIGVFLCWFAKMTVYFTAYGISEEKLSCIVDAIRSNPLFREVLISALKHGG